MKHIAAYLLLQLGGNAEPSAADIKEVLMSVGIEADNDRLEPLLRELHGKDINELISEGTCKLATVVGGGNATEQTTVTEITEVKGAVDHDDHKEGDSCDDCGDDDLGLDLFE